jgi:hypothetical protein
MLPTQNYNSTAYVFNLYFYAVPFVVRSVITIVPAHPELCVYVVLDSTRANLALARMKLQGVVKTLVF